MEWHQTTVSHFRVFGCVSYVHVPYRKQTKLDNKSIKCVLLGISEESKAYRLYDLLSRKVLISRDVIFNEEESWPWDDNYTEAIQASLDWSDLDEDSHHDDKNEATNNPAGDIHEENSEQHTLEEHIIVDSVIDPSNDLFAVLISKPVHKRARHPPSWMRDYESGEKFSDDDDQVNLLYLLIKIL